MKSNLYKAYLSERYKETDFAPYTIDQVAENFEKLERNIGNLIFTTDKSFATYRLQGDAIIIDDIYVKPEFRKALVSKPFQRNREVWKLFDALVELGRSLGKRVVIGFSERIGKNVEAGKAAMKEAGFSKAFETNLKEVFIRGI